jgi:8-oxo-dGTP diphosphatase
MKPSTQEERFLAGYRPEDYARPSVTVDLAVFTVIERRLDVLLVRRNEHPFKGRWALPGGFVRVKNDPADQGEDLAAAARRELFEETGLSHSASASVFLEQVGAFGRPGRDPRMRVISVAYYALVRPTLVPAIRAGGDVSHVRWAEVADPTPGSDMAFDHAEILAAALDRMRRDLDAAPIAFELVPQPFTIQELRNVYEVIGGAPLDPGNFRKRFLRMIDDGIIEAARGKRATASKPASVYRFVKRGERAV